MSSSPPDRASEVDHEACMNRRFLVQLRVDADPSRGVYRGRIQHVRSGEAAHFDSLEELAAFFTDMSARERSDTLAGTAPNGPAP